MARPAASGAPLRSLLGGLLCAITTGCASAPRSAPALVPCASLPGYLEYVDEVAAHAGRGNEREFSKLGRGEQITLVLWLREDGSLEKLQMRSSSSEEMRALGTRSARAAAPYPRPPHALRECVVGRPTEIMLFALGPPCDLDRAEAYIEDVVERVLEPLLREEALRRPGRGRVALRLWIDAAGGLRDVEVARSESDAVAGKARLAAREAAPFPAPDPSFRECLPEPMFLWLVVPGELP